MGLKDFIFRLKIFIWYLGTEPFRQLKELTKMVLHLLEMLNKTRSWMYIAVVGMTIALFLGKKLFAGFFLVFLLIAIFLWEWERGTFMHRWRESIKKKVETEVNENERNR